MNQIKRRIIDTESGNHKIKKVVATFDAQKKSINCIENLPNEIFYDIFDYLEGCLIYEAFSNLNHRFQELLLCSSLRLKINFISYSGLVLEHRSKNIVIPKKHQIISFHFDNAFGESPIFTWFPINAQFNRLESLTFTDIKTGELLLILVGLIFLPRLFSLTIHLHKHSKDLSDIYRLIFNLPRLKYNKLSFKGLKTTISLPMANNKRLSTIEHLIIDYSCTIIDLITILSYTPRLTHLICKQIMRSNSITEPKLSVKLFKLTYLSIHCCCLWFDQLAMFMTNISTQLQELRINICKDFTYLDADRWTQLITNYIPRLHLFKFKYMEKINKNLQISQYHTQVHRFTSLFWTQRQWIFSLSIDTDNQQDVVVVYSIYPIRKKQHDSHEHEDNEINTYNKQSLQQITIPISQTNQLTIANLPAVIPPKKSFTDIISPILLSTSITSLNITYNKIPFDLLMELIQLLPNLDCLVVRSLAVKQPRCLSLDEVKTLRFVSNNNKIIKLKLQQISELIEIQFLMNLCSQTQHLELTYIDDINPELFLRTILRRNIKCVPNLRSLYLGLSTSNENLYGRLEKIIELEKLHHDYIIKLSNNSLYIRWNKEQEIH